MYEYKSKSFKALSKERYSHLSMHRCMEENNKYLHCLLMDLFLGQHDNMFQQQHRQQQQLQQQMQLQQQQAQQNSSSAMGMVILKCTYLHIKLKSNSNMIFHLGFIPGQQC